MSSHRSLPKKSFILPDVGTPVEGVHILGKPYSGKILSVRPHSLNFDLIEFFIELDKPTDFATLLSFKDIRTSLNFAGSIERSSHWESRWVGPSGDHFDIISA